MNDLLKIEKLKAVYKTDEAEVKALNDVSLTLKKGETLGLVGETGAGKTTLALSILKLLPQGVGEITEGTIWFDDVDITSANEKTMREIRGNQISMIFQDPMTSLNPILTIGDQIAEAIELHRSDLTKEQIQNRVDEMLTLVGISPARKKEYPHQFSGGMKQRVVIAIALACEPKLLLADEPTTALDVTIQAQVLAMMSELKDRLNTSMIMITHDLGVVAEICDRVAIVYAGEIIEAGSLHEIFEGEEHHPYTKGLFGSIPDINTKARRLSPIDGLMPDPSNLPDGCKFHPRCPYAADICRKELPAENRAKDGHIIKCHKFCGLNDKPHGETGGN